jgi:hypothetical protein
MKNRKKRIRFLIDDRRNDQSTDSSTAEDILSDRILGNPKSRTDQRSRQRYYNHAPAIIPIISFTFKRGA